MPIIAIAMGGILFSCVDSGKDLYDPSYETSNPMGATSRVWFMSAARYLATS